MAGTLQIRTRLVFIASFPVGTNGKKTPILQKKKLRHKEVSLLIEGHRSDKD